MRVPVIDGDILLYEVGFAAESSWKHIQEEKGFQTEDPPHFDMVEEILLNRVGSIVTLSESTEKPEFYFTGHTNFRNEIAVSKKYKDRPSRKPFHYYNIKAYIQGMWDWYLTEGLEADDLLSIRIGEDPNAICCSRDKDLLQSPGWHYQWELGKQPSFGPFLVEGYGEIHLTEKHNKIKGWGNKFFLSQILTGDPVDTIPGLPSCGPVAAFKILSGTTTYDEGIKAVTDAYMTSGKDIKYLREQGQLLWMVKKLDEDGDHYMWGLNDTY